MWLRAFTGSALDDDLHTVLVLSLAGLDLSLWCGVRHSARATTRYSAIHLKLDELIRVSREARNELIGLEAKSETMTHQIRSAFEDMQRR